MASKYFILRSVPFFPFLLFSFSFEARSVDRLSVDTNSPCSIFDMNCLLKWLSIYERSSNRNACPMCRTPLFSEYPHTSPAISYLLLVFSSANFEIRLDLCSPEPKLDVEHLRWLVARAQQDQLRRDVDRSDLLKSKLVFVICLVSLGYLHLDPTPINRWIMAFIAIVAGIDLFHVWREAKAREQRANSN